MLWFGYGAVAGVVYRIARGDWKRDEHIRLAVKAVLILAASGLVIGIVKGMVGTAVALVVLPGAPGTR